MGSVCAPRGIRRPALLACIAAVVALVGLPAAAAARPKPAMFYVGFSKQDITPAQLPFDYLGGEGY